MKIESLNEQREIKIVYIKIDESMSVYMNKNYSNNQNAYIFGVSAIDDDAVAVRSGGHLTGWTGTGASSCGLETTPCERVQVKSVNIIVINIIPVEQRTYASQKLNI